MEASVALSKRIPAEGRSGLSGEECQTLTFAHLSDPHLTTLDTVQARQLLSKRLLGYLSWRRRRRHEHRREVVDALVADIAARQPDHLVITGDLTHLGTAAECREARRWLDALGDPQRVTVVPGNHDTYADDDWDDTVGQWRAYMRGDRSTLDGAGDFPSVRRRGPAAIIGVNTAWPTPPLLATGRIGDDQLARLASILRNSREEGLFRVVLLHHPVTAGAVSRRKALDDAAPLRAMLAREGAELVLHGHGHRSMQRALPGPDGTEIPVFAAPSASAIGTHSRHSAGYYGFRVDAADAGEPHHWRLGVEVRSYDPSARRFRPTHRQALHLAPSA